MLVRIYEQWLGGFFLIFLLFISSLFPQKVKAEYCVAYSSYNDCDQGNVPAIGYVDCSCFCHGPGGIGCVAAPGCHIELIKQPGSGCAIDYYAVCNNCAPGPGNTPPPGSSCPGYCNSSACGSNGACNCNDFGWEAGCNSAPGGTCSWTSFGGNDGVCNGRYCCGTDCSNIGGKDLCEAVGCGWHPTNSGWCKDSCSLNGQSCGQMTCRDQCTNNLINDGCGSQSCSTPPPSSPTPTPTPSPTPTPTPNPFPAWFQTAGGDVHANGRLGTTIPNTCGTVCSLFNSTLGWLKNLLQIKI